MKNYIEILGNTELFKNINDNEIETLLKSSFVRIKNYNNNETVFMSGNIAKFIGIVVFGQVEVIQEDFYGNKNIIATYKQRRDIWRSFCLFRNAISSNKRLYITAV